jgi:putative transposase
MVFCIKYRHSLLLVEERCEYLKQVFKEIGERYWLELEEMGTDGDHVHVFVGAAPKYAPSRVMQVLKSISAPRDVCAVSGAAKTVVGWRVMA